MLQAQRMPNETPAAYGRATICPAHIIRARLSSGSGHWVTPVTRPSSVLGGNVLIKIRQLIIDLMAGDKLTISPLFKLSVVACLLASLGACSSGSTPTEDNELPSSNLIVNNDNNNDNNPPSQDKGGLGGTETPVVTPDYGDLPDPVIPQLDPWAEPIPMPDPADPFGYWMEIDSEQATAGGPPTQPKNLRIDLVSNNWAEFSWAPSNDDTGVVEYRIKRSDGHTYVLRGDTVSPNVNTQIELDKRWLTTSFIDCNYTRFSGNIYNCYAHGPRPGDIFTYEVTAVDGQGNESMPSEPITIRYHQEQNAPVPLYFDRYLDESKFAQNHDLSNPAYFLDKFNLVFEDEFDGTSLDPTRWNTQLVWGDEVVINNEQQYFVNSLRDPDFGYDPFKLENSILTIEAIPTPEELKSKLPEKCRQVNEYHPPCEFLSGALATQDLFGFTYGYVEARMKTSDISGALSSFYLYHRFKGSGVERHAPEIDIVEYLGENPYGDEDVFQTYHFDDVNKGVTRSSPTMSYKNPDGTLFSDEFHTYGVLWEPQLIIWYVDGQETSRITGPQVGAMGMNIVLYLVAGSGWAPTPDLNGPFPLQFQIDYVRAYQRDTFVGNGTYPQ